MQIRDRHSDDILIVWQILLAHLFDELLGKFIDPSSFRKLQSPGLGDLDPSFLAEGLAV
jgi:hypothetical protein